MHDGMSVMNHRTTFALDKTTAKTLKRLAGLWRVSQAEVVRRAVAQADMAAVAAKPDPVALLRQLHAAGDGLGADQANAYLTDVRKARAVWRRK